MVFESETPGWKIQSPSMIVLRVPWLPFRETRIPSSFPSSIFRPFYNIFSSPPSIPETSSTIRKLGGSPHLPFSSCPHNYAALGASVLPSFLKIYPPFVLHANTNTPTPPWEDGGRILRGISLSPEWRAGKLISYDGTNKNSVLRADYPSSSHE